MSSHTLLFGVKTTQWFRKQNLTISLKYEIFLTFDPAMPLLGIYHKEILPGEHREVHSVMLYLTITYKSKQLTTCLSVNGQWVG